MGMVKLSKSGYCTGLQCPKILWLDKNLSEEKDESVMDQSRLDAGIKAGDLAREYFGDYKLVLYSEEKNYMTAETQRLIDAKTPVICEATFAINECFCRVDILRRRGDGFEIVEVKSSTGMKDLYLDDMSFQRYVLEACGVKIKKVSLMHINSQYERMGELKIQELFTLVDCTAETESKQKELSANIQKIKEVAGSEKEPDIAPGKQCDEPYECGYKDYCYRNITMEESVSKNTPPVVDKAALKAFLETLSYPLYHLDFETFREVIPSYDRQRPYQQIPCQYSIHIQSEPFAEPEHREFLAEAGADPRREIAERLCADIPKDVCVLAYNMSFEKGRIAELAALFPDLSPHLMAIHDNVRDLIVPFRKKAWHSEAQEGSNSIKAVLPAMFPNDSELDYNRLDLIHNGGEAMNAYAELPTKTPDEQERIRTALLAYCRLDTLAMVRILDKLQQTLLDS